MLSRKAFFFENFSISISNIICAEAYNVLWYIIYIYIYIYIERERERERERDGNKPEKFRKLSKVQFK